MAASNREKKCGASEDHYPYQLVKFFTKNKKGEADIDFVPSTWVTFNVNTGKCECKYLPPPYNNDDFDLLHEFVKKKVPPPESWPSYPITLCGHAKTYDDAAKRIEILRIEEYAYTTDENVSKAHKAATDTQTYRTKVTKSNTELIKKLMNVPKITTTSENDRSSDASERSNDSLNESTTEGSEDDCITPVSNQKGARKTATGDTSKLADSEFPCDEDYMTENSNKSARTSRQKPVSKNSNVKPRVFDTANKCHSSVALGGSSKSEKRTDASGLRSSFSKPEGRTEASDLLDASPRTKRTDAFDLLNASARTKKRTDSSGSHSAPLISIATNSNRAETTGTKKETKASLVTAIDALRVNIEMMTKEFRELTGIIKKSALAQDAFGANVESFTSEHDVNFPILDMDKFKAFDGRLKDEKKIRKEFTATLHYLVNPQTNLSKNITAMLKKHLTRKVAINFTAVKASGAKSIFKETCFCKCMLEVVRMKCKTIDKDIASSITEKQFYHELGNALSNAVDWDGKRKQRVTNRKSAEKEKEIDEEEEEAMELA